MILGTGFFSGRLSDGRKNSDAFEKCRYFGLISLRGHRSFIFGFVEIFIAWDVPTLSSTRVTVNQPVFTCSPCVSLCVPV